MKAHPGMFEINNAHRMKGWQSPMARPDYKQGDFSVPIGWEASAPAPKGWTGAKMPDGADTINSMGKAGMTYGAGSYPGGCKFCCCVICPMFCTNFDLLPKCCCCLGTAWAMADVCCLRRCKSFHPAITMPPVGAKSFNGADIRYYTDKKYLQWPFFGTEAAAAITEAPAWTRNPPANSDGTGTGAAPGIVEIEDRS